MSERATLSVREVAERTGVSEDAVRRWINRGLLPAFRYPGGRKQPILRVLERDLDAFQRHYKKDVVDNSNICSFSVGAHWHGPECKRFPSD